MFVRYRFLVAALICGSLATAIALLGVFPTASARPYRSARCAPHQKHC